MRTRLRTRIALGTVLVSAITLIAATMPSLADAAAGAPAARHRRAPRMPDAAVSGCDVLQTAPAGHDCLLPWPNDAFTVAARTATGRRLNISSKVDPTNVHGVHVDTTAQNKADGFSPGSVIMAYVPSLSIAASRIATSTNIGLSLARNAPIVILDTKTH